MPCLIILIWYLVLGTTGLRTGSRLLIANDPDADRLAVAERIYSSPGGWLTFSGNEIGILLADWLWRNHKKLNPRVSE